MWNFPHFGISAPPHQSVENLFFFSRRFSTFQAYSEKIFSFLFFNPYEYIILYINAIYKSTKVYFSRPKSIVVMINLEKDTKLDVLWGDITLARRWQGQRKHLGNPRKVCPEVSRTEVSYTLKYNN